MSVYKCCKCTGNHIAILPLISSSMKYAKCSVDSTQGDGWDGWDGRWGAVGSRDGMGRVGWEIAKYP